MRRAFSVCACLLLLLTSCATSVPRNQVQAHDAVASLSQGIGAFHDVLYVPAMADLKRRGDAGDQWVVDRTRRIQVLAEDYERISASIGELLRTWDTPSAASISLKIIELMDIITALQRIQAGLD